MVEQLENKILNEASLGNPVGNLINLADISHICYGPSYSVSEELKKRGYCLAGHMNLKIGKQKKSLSSFIGILKNQKPIQKKILGIKLNKKQKAIYIGKIWFNNKSKNADENKKWILQVYGRRHLSEMTKLFNSLSKPYGVKLDVHLKSEYIVKENYLFDILND